MSLFSLLSFILECMCFPNRLCLSYFLRSFIIKNSSFCLNFEWKTKIKEKKTGFLVFLSLGFITFSWALNRL